MIANAATQALFRNDLARTVLSGTPFAPSGRGKEGTGGDGGTKLTIAEMLRWNSLGTARTVGGEEINGKTGSDIGVMDVIWQNLENNWGQLLASSILIPIGFKVVKKLTRKSRSQANMALKQLGVGNMVKV